MKTSLLGFLALFILLSFLFSPVIFAKKEAAGKIYLKPIYNEVYQRFYPKGDWVRLVVIGAQNEELTLEETMSQIDLGIRLQERQDKLLAVKQAQ